MTVIAWDGKTLAADKQATAGSLKRTVTKLRRLDSKRIAGVAGNMSAGVAMLKWLMSKKKGRFPLDVESDEYSCSVLVIERGKILVYEGAPDPLEFEDECFAIGSGRDFALAAMHCGKTAAEAVLVTQQFDCGCGNGVDTLTLLPEVRKGRARR